MRHLGLLLLCLACACDGGSSASASLTGPDPAARAAVTGVVMELPASPQLQQAAGLVVVGSPAEAPAGATPLAGADVTVLARPDLTVEGTATTGADGSFRVDGLAITHAVLEIRRDPAGAADVSRLLTLVRGATIVAGAPYPIDREDAIDLAMAEVPAGAGVVGSQNPLPAGTLVFPTLGNALAEAPTMADTHVVAEGDEWLVFVDPEPDTAFEHDVSFLFVHAQTGAVTELPALSWPSLNFVPIWAPDGDLVSLGAFHPLDLFATGEFPGDAEVTLSEDIVTLPDPSDPPPESGLASLAQAVDGVDPQDFFGVFWAGSTEPWFILDLFRMRGWAYDQGLPAANQKTIVYGESLANLTPADGVTIIPSDSDPAALAANTAAVLAELAQKVQARRDAGGDPLLFVFATSHGNKWGQLLVLDNVFRGIGRRYVPGVFGHQLYIDADKILPIHTIPACRVRVALTCCRAKSHLLKWYPHYAAMKPPPDFQFYSASGTQVATGRKLTSALWAQVKNFQTPNLHTVKPVGVFFSREWASGGASFGAGGDLDFSMHLGGSFTSYTKPEPFAAHRGTGRDDRLCFDPGHPDPCLPGPEPPPDDLVTFSDSATSITRHHTVGVDTCPQPLYEITITNVTSAPVELKITAGNHLFVTGGETVTLAPGESHTAGFSFDCSTQQQFTSPLRIEATGSGTSETRDIDLTLKFN